MSLATFGYERFQEAARVAECACAYAERQSHRRRDARHAIRGSTEPDGACGDVGLGKYCRGKAAKKRTGVRSFLGYALASTSELENHLIVAHDIRVVTESDYRSLLAQLADVRKMLHGLMTRLADSSSSTRLVSFSERRQAPP